MAKTRGLRRLQKAAKMGRPHEQYLLGLRYQLGKEVPKDMAIAFFWIQLAAESGHYLAKEWLEDYAFDDDANIQANC